MPLIQDGRLANVSFAGDEGREHKDRFLLRRLRGTETLSKPFRFHLELVSPEEGIPFGEMIGRAMSVSTLLPDGNQRQFNGVVARFVRGEEHSRDAEGRWPLYSYKAELVPWLWTLTKSSNCRIYEGKSVPAILEQVFRSHGYIDYHLESLHGTYDALEYVAQYNETDFDFVSRLMEKEGIGYCFEHVEGRHDLVLFDVSPARPAIPGEVTHLYVGARGEQRTGSEIERWQPAQHLLPGTYSVTDYNFEDPDLLLYSSTSSNADLGGDPSYEYYEDGASHVNLSGGDRYARLRMEAHEADSNAIQGRGCYAAFSAGLHFALTGHPTPANNGRYLLTSVQHWLRQGLRTDEEPSTYWNGFSCIPLEMPFRPPRDTARPRIRGVQTALVVGPPGEEIYVDQYGRVRVLFHWDRDSQRDGSQGCWVRVVQGLAGHGYGAVYTPRVGQEVVVSFLDGDPDRPIVTGSVYNGEQHLPFGAPQSKTQSGIRSHTVGGSPQDFNEIRMEDKQGEEELYIQAERNKRVKVKLDTFEEVGRDAVRRVERDEMVKLGRDQNLDLGRNQLIRIGEYSTLEVGEQVRLTVGKASLQLKSDGTIILDGVDIWINGENLNLHGDDTFSYSADAVSVSADSSHQIRGAVVKHNC